MKFTALLIASAVAAATAADTPNCDATKLVTLVAGADGIACTKASGYSVAALAVPTEPQIVKICGNANCQALFKSFTAAEPTECLLTNAKKLHAEMLDPVLAACTKLAAVATNATATAKPSTTTEVAKTTETSTKASSSSSAGSAGNTTEVKTCCTTYDTRTSSAATMAVATGALLAAAAATLF